MDRDSLERFLAEGLSLAEIGRRVGRHEATVAYWLQKHGLSAAHQHKHAARGGLDRDALAVLVEEGLSIAQIAERVDRSKATVRHWLKRYALKTRGDACRVPKVEVMRARDAGLDRLNMKCPRHGQVEFVIEGSGRARCRQCRSDAVSRRRRKVKLVLVHEAGGACFVCGYSRYAGALHFHHIDPAKKRLEMNARGTAVALATLRAEARKCVLLCATCHAEVEAGLVTLPADTHGS
jgi:transposase